MGKNAVTGLKSALNGKSPPVEWSGFAAPKGFAQKCGGCAVLTHSSLSLNF